MLYAILKFLDSFPSKKEKEKNTRIYSSKFSIAKDYLKDFFITYLNLLEDMGDENNYVLLFFSESVWSLFILGSLFK